MWKFKFFLNFEKEEKWLNEMARKGYQLENATFGYTFRKSEPEDTIIKIDYRKFRNKKDFIDYCTLFEDSGWKHISGTYYSGTQYFKKQRKDSNDDIFSDQYSKAGKYQRLSKGLIQLSISYLPLFIVLVMSGAIQLKAFLDPKQLYFTPGLWDKNGFSFWFSFLFETPFALMRGFAWLVIPVSIIFCLFYSIQANRLYKKVQKIL